MKKVISFVIAASLFILPVNKGEAHPGGKDELGGHFKRADCTYHFHGMTKLAKGKSKKQLVSLIKKYNSNNKCTRQLTTKKISL